MEPLEPQDPATLEGGKYTLLGILGEGSMGRTYLAENTDGVKVAIKTLFPSRLASLKDLELFHREADILARLDHNAIPSYVNAFDITSDDDEMQYFLVQQYVAGDTLRKKLIDGERFDDASIRKLALQLLDPLVYMHDQDPPVVHRDLKPDNIIIGEYGTPFIVDFGAVREVVRLTMGGGSTIIGSYGYMPPEQLMGRAIPSSDLYSLGVTLVECLTRQTPKDLTGKDALRLIDSTTVDERTKRILKRLCSPTIDDRYESASDARDDFKTLESGGALMVATKIETQISKREAAELAELKKRDQKGIAFYASVGAGGLASVAFVALVWIILTVFQSVSTAYLAGGAASAVGLAIMFVLIANQVSHDAWEVPTREWIKTSATIKGQFRDEVNGMAYVKYEFPTRRGIHIGQLPVAMDSWFSKAPEVMKEGDFTVYYKPSSPNIHEMADFTVDAKEPTDLSLFNPRNKHS